MIFFYNKFDDIFFRARTVKIVYDIINTVSKRNKHDS